MLPRVEKGEAREIRAGGDVNMLEQGELDEERGDASVSYLLRIDLYLLQPLAHLRYVNEHLIVDVVPKIKYP